MSIDWTPIFENYKGKWVALREDEQTVVGVGKTVKEAVTDAKKKGYNEPYLLKVPEKLMPYIGTCS